MHDFVLRNLQHSSFGLALLAYSRRLNTFPCSKTEEISHLHHSIESIVRFYVQPNLIILCTLTLETL